VVVVSDAPEGALAGTLKRLAEAGPVDAVSLAELDPVGAWEAISEVAASANP